MILKWLDIKRWEHWPFGLIYAPLSLVWVAYIIRSKAIWFFTSSNPSITFGGMEGETKSEMYAQLPKELYPKTLIIDPTLTIAAVEAAMEQNGMCFPLAAKPDVGAAGLMFRRISTIAQLIEYHEKIGENYVLQSFVGYPMELSVFYFRYPNQSKGTITGFLHKIPMYVVGDGSANLLQLIQHHPKAKARLPELRRVHGAFFEKVLPSGTKYPLSYAANHNRGATFVNLQSEIDEQLQGVFDRISNAVTGWYFGRFDLMTSSIEDLKQGKQFKVLEYNGCGAEPNHIYDAGLTLREAYKEILMHWKVLFEISRYNRNLGVKDWPAIKGWRFLRSAQQHLDALSQKENTLSF